MERQRDLIFLPKCLEQPGLRQAETTSQELLSATSTWTAEAQVLESSTPAFRNAHEQKARLEQEELGLDKALEYGKQVFQVQLIAVLVLGKLLFFK